MNGARPAATGRGRATSWPGPMALKQMRCYLAVLRAGSITKAAEALHMAQPAIGMQIHNLETDLGVELLIRHSRGVTPTGAGEVLAEHAARIVAKAERMRLEIMDMGGEPRGRIVLGLTGTARWVLAARLVETCRRDYPDLALTLVGGPSQWLADRLAQGRLDIAVTYDPPENSGAETEPLAIEPLYFVTPPSHKLAGGMAITLRAALGADLVLPPKPSMIRRRMADAARANGADLRCVCDAESESAMTDLARRGVACAILPYGAARQDVEAGHLAAVRIVDPELVRTLYMTCSESRLGTRALEAVRGEIRALAAGSVELGAVGWTSCTEPEKAPDGL